MRKYKYTPELLAEAAASSKSIADVLRYLGIPWSGGTHAHISRRLKHFGIDTSHFRRGSPNKGRPSTRRHFPAQVLIITAPGSPRQKPALLRRVLRETGVPYACSACRMDDVWQGRPLTLHVDHINGDWLDNRQENLRFLCPNRHSQTDNFAGKGRGRGVVAHQVEATVLGTVQSEFESRRPHPETNEEPADHPPPRAEITKVNLTLAAEDAAFLERYVAAEGARSRSAAIRKAIALLRAQQNRREHPGAPDAGRLDGRHGAS